MFLETERLIIRSLCPSDEKALIEMASDGSLTEIYGDCSECCKWMGEFISDAIKFEAEDNPYREYLAFTTRISGRLALPISLVRAAAETDMPVKRCNVL